MIKKTQMDNLLVNQMKNYSLKMIKKTQIGVLFIN